LKLRFSANSTTTCCTCSRSSASVTGAGFDAIAPGLPACFVEVTCAAPPAAASPPTASAAPAAARPPNKRRRRGSEGDCGSEGSSCWLIRDRSQKQESAPFGALSSVHDPHDRRQAQRSWMSWPSKLHSCQGAPNFPYYFCWLFEEDDRMGGEAGVVLGIEDGERTGATPPRVPRDSAVLPRWRSPEWRACD